MVRRSLITLALLLFASNAAAIRLHDAERNGPYVGIGAGGGVLGATGGTEFSEDLDFGTSGGLTVNFRVGFALSDYITVGIETSGWAKKFDLEDGAELSVNIFFTGIAGTIYPNNVGYYLRGGLGVSTASGVLKRPRRGRPRPGARLRVRRHRRSGATSGASGVTWRWVRRSKPRFCSRTAFSSNRPGTFPSLHKRTGTSKCKSCAPRFSCC